MSIYKKFKNKLQSEYERKDWILLFALSSITPASMFFSPNVSYFSLANIISSLIFIGLISYSIALVLQLAITYIKPKETTKAIFIFLITITCSLLFCKTAPSIFPEFLHKNILIVLTIFCFCFCIFIKGINIVNFVLFICLCLSMSNAFYREITDIINYNDKLNKENYHSITLNNKPNIYYILCESMNSLDIAEEIYGVEGTTEFRNFLTDNGFIVGEDIYSNGDHTLATLLNIFSMDIKRGVSTGMLDATSSTRHIIAGNDGNALLKILKDNGYETSYFLKGSSYYFKRKGKYLDNTDVDKNTTLEPINYLKWELAKIAKSISSRFYYENYIPEQDDFKILENFLENNTSQPRFFMHRLAFTDHTPTPPDYSYKKLEEWLKSGKYREGYYLEMEGIKKFTSTIIKKDPNAIILFMGDHGAWRFRSDAKNNNELNEVLKELNITKQEYFDDRFKIFSAIRAPYLQKDFRYSPGNVFPFIFESIGYEGKKLEKQPNYSYSDFFTNDKDKPILINGKINL